jgi:large subunit ribosomal protein L1
MHFPVDDVVKNIRHFMSSVKRVTGNTKEAEDSRKLKNSGAKPGKLALDIREPAVL